MKWGRKPDEVPRGVVAVDQIIEAVDRVEDAVAELRRLIQERPTGGGEGRARADS